MKIYFVGSIRGGREDTSLYNEIINHLKKYGEVLTEHIGDSNLTEQGEAFTDNYIHDRDLKFLEESDLIVAEVSTLSLGVGYEIGRAVEKNKKILCLYRVGEKKLSAMINGCPELKSKKYRDLTEAKEIIDQFFSTGTQISNSDSSLSPFQR